MKRQYTFTSILLMICLLFFAHCDGPDYGPMYVRVKSFTWDGALYKAQYDRFGKLTKLIANASDISFLYDENNKLYKATMRNMGESVPRFVFEFKQGSCGIIESRRYFNAGDGQLHLEYIEKMNYATATRLSSLIEQEVREEGDSVVIAFQLDRKFEYTGNNVSRIYTVPAFTEYSASAYDNKPNPFMMLAQAVGNPAFFPVGRFVNYPVVDLNIPLIAVFSCNNPLKARYGFPQTNTFFDQAFAYTYTPQGLVTEIVWNPDSPQADSRTFLFEYESCRRR